MGYKGTMIYVHLDNLKTPKNDEESLLFSVYVQFAQLGALIIPGWRFKNGALSPPASKVGPTWFPVTYLSDEVGEAIYNAIKKVDLKPFPRVTPPETNPRVRSLISEEVKQRLMPNFRVEKGMSR